MNRDEVDSFKGKRQIQMILEWFRNCVKFFISKVQGKSMWNVINLSKWTLDAEMKKLKDSIYKFNWVQYKLISTKFYHEILYVTAKSKVPFICECNEK